MTSPAISKNANKPFTAQQWTALVAGFILMLLSGLVNGWSIFVEPIEQDLHLLRQDTALVFTISLSVSIGGQMLAGLLNRYVQSRYIYWLVALFSLLGFLGTSTARGIWAIYLFYGVFSGLAIGMIYNLVLTGVGALFERGTSLISGVLLMGFGVGPLALGVGASFLINRFGWRASFVVLAVLYAVLLVGASFVIRSRKSGDALATGDVGGQTTRQMMASRPYQYFFLWCVALGSATLILIGHSSLISRDIGAGFNVASLMTGVISVSSGVSRVIFGRMADVKGGSALKTTLTVCAISGSVAVFAGYVMGLLPVLALGYVLVGASNGGNAVYICDFVKEKYGNAHYGMNIAVTNVYMILGSTLGSALAGTIKTQTGSYTIAFVVMLVYALLSALFGLLLGRATSNAAVPQPRSGKEGLK